MARALVCPGALLLCVTAAFPPPWRPPRRAGVQFQRGDERRLQAAPVSPRKEGRKAGGARGPQRPGLGPGSAVAGTGLAAVASRVWRASSLCGRGSLGAAPRPPRVTSFVARGAGVGGLLPAGCTASVAELFFVSPGAGWKCGACTLFAPARRLQPATRRQLSWVSPSDLSPRGRQLGHLGQSFWKLEREGRGGAAWLLQTRGRAPKLVRQVQRPLIPRAFLYPGSPTPQGLSSRATDFQQFPAAKLQGA